MRRDEIIAVYDDDYARSYEEKFLLSPETRADSEHELQLLRGFLASGVNWLDVACGTGYFLSHFPEVERAGCDLSPAMLRRARQANPASDRKWAAASPTAIAARSPPKAPDQVLPGEICGASRGPPRLRPNR